MIDLIAVAISAGSLVVAAVAWMRKAPAGAPGVEGRPGRDGKDGRDGRDGIDGIDGRRGAPGEVGPVGPKGEKGDKGDEGPRGRDGVNGLDGKIWDRTSCGHVGATPMYCGVCHAGEQRAAMLKHFDPQEEEEVHAGFSSEGISQDG